MPKKKKKPQGQVVFRKIKGKVRPIKVNQGMQAVRTSAARHEGVSEKRISVSKPERANVIRESVGKGMIGAGLASAAVGMSGRLVPKKYRAAAQIGGFGLAGMGAGALTSPIYKYKVKKKKKKK